LAQLLLKGKAEGGWFRSPVKRNVRRFLLMAVPTLAEFKQTCSEAFAFLTTDYSFAEVPPPLREDTNPFEVCFSNSNLTVIVEGYSYGSSAGVSFEDRAGRRASFHYLTWRELPPAERYTFGEGGQLALIRQAAQYLRRFGGQLLRGDMTDLEWMLEEDAKFWRNSDEVKKLWPYQRASEEANSAFSRGDYKRVVELLSPFTILLSGSQRKKFEYAQKRNQSSG
jgi:hypothetical protein